MTRGLQYNEKNTNNITCICMSIMLRNFLPAIVVS
jgi:hypothetical protein